MKKKIVTVLTSIVLCICVAFLFGGCSTNESQQQTILQPREQEEQKLNRQSEIISNDFAMIIFQEAKFKAETYFNNYQYNFSIKTEYDYSNNKEMKDYVITREFATVKIESSFNEYDVMKYARKSSKETQDYENNDLYYNNTIYNIKTDSNSQGTHLNANFYMDCLKIEDFTIDYLLYAERLENGHYILKFANNFVDSDNNYNSYTAFYSLEIDDNGMFLQLKKSINTNTSSGNFNVTETYKYGNVDVQEIKDILIKSLSK